MRPIRVLTLLRNYKRRVKADKISFLISETDKNEILLLIDNLIKSFVTAEKKAKRYRKRSPSEFLDWADAHKDGRKLWEKLASGALNEIDPLSKGNAKLFEFIDSATRFEDLLYGLEPYYRDHTLHSLWVYFLGEHIMKDLLPKNIQKNLTWYLYNDIEKEKEKYSYPESFVKFAIQKENKIKEELDSKRDAIWCVMALCHDLGYSLEKLDILNEKVQDVLGFFELSDYRKIGYSLQIEHQYLISQFLELMAMDVRIVPKDTYQSELQDKDRNKITAEEKLEELVLIRCYRDDSTYWRLCQALEEKQHGILSSYLIYKMLGIFADAWIRGSAEEWGLEDKEATDNILRGDILFAIAQHEFKFAHLYQVGSLADILILSDELEEFSRYGRQMLSRKYYDTTAKTEISFTESSGEEGIEIDIKYEVTKHHPLNMFFKHKAEKLCRFYSLSQPVDEYFSIPKINTIKNIKMTVEQNKKKYYINLHDNTAKDNAYLPSIKGYSKGEYRIECLDDQIMVITSKNGKKISFDKWFA